MHEKVFEDLIIKKNSGQKGSHIQYEKHEMAINLISKSDFSLTEKLEPLQSGVK